MSQEEARKEKHRISLTDIGRGNPLSGSEQLPWQNALDIVEHRLPAPAATKSFDVMLNMQAKAESTEQSSPVNSQIDRLAAVLKVGRA